MNEEFLQKLHALLNEYNAQLRVYDRFQGYAECGRDLRIEVEFEDGSIPDIDLGSWIDGKGHGCKKLTTDDQTTQKWK